MKKYLMNALIILMFLIGLSVLLYPAISEYVNEKHASRIVASYNQIVASASEEQIAELMAQAHDYNDRLTATSGAFFNPDSVPGYDETLDKEVEQILDNDALYQKIYSPGANSWWWYDGSCSLSVKASSCLLPSGKSSYQAENAFDTNHDTAWVEGVEGQGVGEFLEYEFSGDCPRITTVRIMNGYVKNHTAWRENSRVRKLKMYYQGKPYAILELQDSRSLQSFDVGKLGPHDEKAPNWTLRFEILEVYEGEKYEDTVISELYFDGIDVH